MHLVGDFTDTNRIRGALGLDDRDLSDQQITHMNVEIELEIALYSWFPDYQDQYDTWFNSGLPTAPSKNSINLLSSYCTFYAAYLVATTLELLIQKTITDSKMTSNRFNKVDFDKIRSNMLGKSRSAKEVISVDLGLPIDSVSPTLFSSASPNFDPVTGT